MASREQIERAAKAVKNEFSKVVGEFGLTRAKEIVPSNHRYIRAALDAARPAPEARSVVERYGVDGEWMRYSSHATALAEANEKIERLERERAALHAAGKDAHLSILKEEQARIERLKKALRALEEANDRLASARSTAIYNSLIDAGLADILMALDDARRDARAALQQEGENDV